MSVVVLAICAAVSYLIGGLNSAIILSKLVYGEDIRTKGSKNPGFTNFKRVYGGSIISWSVMLLDILKTVLPVLLSAVLTQNLYGLWQTGAAVSGLFCTIGHCLPVWYGFKGGKGFLTAMTMLWVIDWRCGLTAFIVMAVLLLTMKYMSLATIAGLVTGAVVLAVMHLGTNPACVILYLLCVSLMVFRHRENIKRLKNGTESKFSLKKKQS